MDTLDLERLIFMYNWFLTIYLCHLQMERRKRTRRFGVRPMLRMRESRGHYMALFKHIKEHDHEQFFKYTRMSSAMFDTLLGLVRHKLLKRSRRKPICPEERLAMTLKFLSQGGSIQSLAWEFFVGKSTAAKVVYETCQALWDVLSPVYLAQPNYNGWVNIAQGFEETWNLANCVGAVDGKHITIQAPANTGSKFFSYKKTYSIVLMAACDHKYRFTLVDVGAYGSQSDSGIFNESWFGRSIVENTLDLPGEKNLPGSDISFPHFFVGDEAFPLRSTMMRPFPGRTGVLPLDVKVFNYRLSRARRVIENAFGILVARWRIFRSVITANEYHTETLVKGAICLHNFIMHSEEAQSRGQQKYCPTNFVDTEENGGNWRKEVSNSQLRRTGRLGANFAAREAVQLRLKLKSYLMTEEGQVDWQYEMVNRGGAMVTGN